MSENTKACSDLCQFVANTGNVSKHLRIVHDYAVHNSTEDGIPGDICSSLSILAQLVSYIEPVEQIGSKKF